MLVSAPLKYLRLDHNSVGAIIHRPREPDHVFVVHIFEAFDEPGGIFSSNGLNRLGCCKDSESLALSGMYSQIEGSSDFFRKDRGDHVGFKGLTCNLQLRIYQSFVCRCHCDHGLNVTL